jgi:uncharacterized phage-associated protein
VFIEWDIGNNGKGGVGMLLDGFYKIGNFLSKTVHRYVYTNKSHSRIYAKRSRKWYTDHIGRDTAVKGANGMHTVFDVAKYILSKTGSLTTMKLQKLVYYAQAWSLAWDDRPLFDEDFEAWANGPVCPPLFSAHKGIFVVDENSFKAKQEEPFTDDEIETMDNVLAYYADKSPQWLSNLTHLELPWQLARKGTPIGAPSSAVISKDSMQQYYGGLGADGEA